MTRAVEAWERFWFAPQYTSTLALFRIAFGLLVLLWTIALSHDMFDFFASDGILSSEPDFSGRHGVWGVLNIVSADWAVPVLFIVLGIVAACLTVGFHTRLASVLVFVGLLSLQRRTPFVFNAGDVLIRVMAFYLMFAPAGESLSVDRWRCERDRFWEFPRRPPWAVRLLQIQLSVIYLGAVWSKVRGVSWNDGTAMSYALRLEDLTRFPVPSFVFDGLLMTNLLTYSALAIEAAIGVLVWNRRARPWVLGLGVALHLGIDYSLRVGFFSYAIIILYMVFIDPDWARSKLLLLRERFLAWSRQRGGQAARGAEAGGK